MALDRLAAQFGASFNRLEAKSLVTKAIYQERRLILAKPQAFMNLSGTAVGSLVRFYKVPLENLMVIYDDVDLPFGVIRIRAAGGSAGQKGMASIIERLGSENFPRLRVGIGRPPGRMEAADYVLEDFSKDEAEILPTILDRAVEAICLYIQNGLDAAMNQYNG
jgi:PTH1 family peptidyl-tRNA hydrolase